MENQELISPSKDQSSIARFKEDIVNALYQIEDKLNNKTHSLESLLNSKLSVFESRISFLDTNYTDVMTKQKELNKQTEVLTDIIPTQTKHEESIISQEIRINSLQKDLTNACYKYDKIFLDNLILPGQIGDYCKYKNLRECLDYMLTQISLLNTFKDKATCESKQLRDKTEQSIKGCLSELEIGNKTCMNYTKNQLELYMSDVNDKIEESIRNAKQMNMFNKEDEHEHSVMFNYNVIKENVNGKLMEMKEELVEMNQFNERAIQDMKGNYNSINESYSSLKNELNNLSQSYSKLEEIVKEIKDKKKKRVDLKVLANDLIMDKSKSNILNSTNNATNSNTTNSKVSNGNGATEQSKNVSKANNKTPNKNKSNNSSPKKSETKSLFRHCIINHSTEDFQNNNSNSNTAYHEKKKNTSFDNIRIKPNNQPNYTYVHQEPTANNTLTAFTIHNTITNTYNNTPQLTLESSKEGIPVSLTNNKRFKGNKVRKSIKNRKRESLVAHNYSVSPNKIKKGNELNGMTPTDTLKIDSLIPIKKQKEHIITKMAKNDNGQLIKTSASCYFNPNKVI